MRISVVTAVYNRVDTIVQAIESVRSQTHDDVEHIIQDGGSTDGTLEKIIDMGSGASSISERDSGIYDALNRGIARASGDVIGLMHSDDHFANDHILEKVAAFFSDPTVDGVYGDLQYVSASDTSRVVRHWRSGDYQPTMLARGWMPPHPTLYLRREIFERFGTYDTTFHIAADYDAMLRYLTRGKIKLAYLPEVMVKMRWGGESNRSLGRIVRKSWEDYRAIRRNRVGGIGTLAAKNVSKVSQFFIREDRTK